MCDAINPSTFSVLYFYSSDELYEQGIFQSIGFKEFHPYLILPDHDKDDDLGKRLLLDCIERLKVVTKQYARKQLKWIRNRFLKSEFSFSFASQVNTF